MFGFAFFCGFLAMMVAYLLYFRAEHRLVALFDAEYPDVDRQKQVPSSLGVFLTTYRLPRPPSAELVALHRSAVRRELVAMGAFMVVLLTGLAGSLLQ